MYNIETLESKIDGKVAFRLKDAPFIGMVVSFGKVQFENIEEIVDSEDATATLKYEYTVEDDFGIDYNDIELETRLGDIMLELIEEGLRENTLIYKSSLAGDLDETNREFDTEQSNPK
jgi:hypothetical protein